MDTKGERIKMKQPAEKQEFFDFYGGSFSNFAKSPFTATDSWGRPHKYETVEHYFQSRKASDRESHDYIIANTWPASAKARGGAVVLPEGWDDVRYEVMLEGLRHKFAIPRFRAMLLETGDAYIREDSPTDFIWGYRNGGLNLLGKALMQVRKEIRREDFERE